MAQLLSNRTILFPLVHQPHSIQVKFTGCGKALIGELLSQSNPQGDFMVYETTVFALEGRSNLTDAV